MCPKRPLNYKPGNEENVEEWNEHDNEESQVHLNYRQVHLNYRPGGNEEEWSDDNESEASMNQDDMVMTTLFPLPLRRQFFEWQVHLNYRPGGNEEEWSEEEWSDDNESEASMNQDDMDMTTLFALPLRRQFFFH